MSGLREIVRAFLEVPLSLIDEPPMPSRSEMDDQKLNELSDDIRRNGVLQPLILGRVGERYEVVAGHRRWHASHRAGLVVVPALVYPSRVEALDAAQFSENAHREELSPADEAIWFHEKLETQCGGDVDVLCARLGIKRTYAENRLLLLSGDPKVFDALQRKQIGIGVAHELNKCTAEEMRRYFLDSAIRGGATQGVVQSWVSQWKRDQGLQQGAPAPVVTSESMPAIPETNYFTCACCGGTDNVHLMRPYNIHQHCKLAIFDPLMKSYRGE